MHSSESEHSLVAGEATPLLPRNVKAPSANLNWELDKANECCLNESGTRHAVARRGYALGTGCFENQRSLSCDKGTHRRVNAWNG